MILSWLTLRFAAGFLAIAVGSAATAKDARSCAAVIEEATMELSAPERVVALLRDAQEHCAVDSQEGIPYLGLLAFAARSRPDVCPQALALAESRGDAQPERAARLRMLARLVLVCRGMGPAAESVDRLAEQEAVELFGDHARSLLPVVEALELAGLVHFQTEYAESSPSEDGLVRRSVLSAATMLCEDDDALSLASRTVDTRQGPMLATSRLFWYWGYLTSDDKSGRTGQCLLRIVRYAIDSWEVLTRADKNACCRGTLETFETELLERQHQLVDERGLTDQ